jgi:nucleotide-binding universal stress UspA family protein
MYKRILAALDGSRGARLALDEALKIAEAADATITAVCVVGHAGLTADVGAGFEDELTARTRAGNTATAALEEAASLFEQHKVRGVVRAVDAYGEGIAQVLARVAGECDADLVVMGTQGRHGVRRMLLGSAAESFLRLTDVPVLLVRHE